MAEYVKEKFKETMRVKGDWQVGAYRWKAPSKHLDEVVEFYKERKIVGSLCDGCGRVYVPPRRICARCFKEIEEKVFVSDSGTVLAYLKSPPLKKGSVKIAGMDAVEAGYLKEDEVIIIAMVRWDGCSSVNTLPLLNADSEKVYPGMRVKAVWAENPRGMLADLRGVEPVDVELKKK
jgi:hypothetical protein